jgi:patatin-like phospholipase/acyl hydrolase
MLILSLDGGGVRGMLTAALILRLEAEIPGWLQHVDLFAGASTGGIIALGLASGGTPQEVFDFYRDRLPEIFNLSWWRRFTTIWRAKYTSDALKRSLDGIFGDAKLGSLEKDVLVATYFLGRENPYEPARAKFYDRSDADVKVADLARWSGSAPTYFPSAEGHVDGGLAANNAAVCAMAYVESKGTPLNEIKVLSLGTGRHTSILEGGDKGLTYWGQKLLIPFVDGSVDVAHFQASKFLGDEGTYHRLQPELTEEIALDDVSRLDDLIEVAEALDLGPTIKWITHQVGPTTS